MNRERSYFSWTRLNNTLCAKLGAKRVGNNIILSIKPKIMIGPHWPGIYIGLSNEFESLLLSIIV